MCFFIYNDFFIIFFNDFFVPQLSKKKHNHKTYRTLNWKNTLKQDRNKHYGLNIIKSLKTKIYQDNTLKTTNFVNILFGSFQTLNASRYPSQPPFFPTCCAAIRPAAYMTPATKVFDASAQHMYNPYSTSCWPSDRLATTLTLRRPQCTFAQMTREAVRPEPSLWELIECAETWWSMRIRQLQPTWIWHTFQPQHGKVARTGICKERVTAIRLALGKLAARCRSTQKF